MGKQMKRLWEKALLRFKPHTYSLKATYYTNQPSQFFVVLGENIIINVLPDR